MRKDCIVAIRRWIKLAPDKFIEIQTIRCVLRAAVEDLNKSVRLQAMYIFMDIFERETCKEYEDVWKMIKKIIYDIKYGIMDKFLEVRVLAVNVLAAIDRYILKVTRLRSIF